MALLKKLGIALLIVGTLSACRGSTLSDVMRVNSGDIKDLTKILNGKNKTTMLYVGHLPKKNAFGEVIGTKGTKLYLAFPDEEKQLLFTTPNLVYDIEKGDINNDGVEDFIIKMYTLSSDFAGVDFKTGTAHRTYLSVDGKLSYRPSDF